MTTTALTTGSSDVDAAPVSRWSAGKTGSDLIADFIAAHCSPDVFVVNGGACAFMIDALGRHPETGFVAMQHEQAAAMAADAIWRTSGRVGVTMATSGPGATNLITGIASSWFDSIPSLHITGQVNDREAKSTIGADVRQSGFQETDIAAMVTTITKHAEKVSSVTELASALARGLRIALSGRMGPVLIDVPMNVQQDTVDEDAYRLAFAAPAIPAPEFEPGDSAGSRLSAFLAGAQRPLAVFGGGLGLAGTARRVQDWCDANGIPYVTSWAGMAFIDRSRPGWLGSQGVYGARHANWAVQAADRIVAFGSRLDNRQRSGRTSAYAPFAPKLVFDIDPEELKKFSGGSYEGVLFDLAEIGDVLESAAIDFDIAAWSDLRAQAMRQETTGWENAVQPGELNPYAIVPALQREFLPGTIVAADTGATVCWWFQSYLADDSHIFTAGGNSPMGYSLPAAIGTQLARPDAPVVAVIGDGGLQMNIQELQTAVAYRTPITIVVFNNAGYGIIKQFQDSNTSGRYYASGDGYTVPDLGAVANAYGVAYHRVESLADVGPHLFERSLKLVEIVVPPNALITPKVDGDHFLHDQFPYEARGANALLPYAYPAKPSLLP